MYTNTRFKVEGGQMITQIEKGKGLDIFNKNIIHFEKVKLKQKIMLLKLENTKTPMKLVYLFSEKLKVEPEYVSLTQALTLD